MLALENVEIRAADTDTADPDQHLSLCGRGIRTLIQANYARPLADNRFHWSLPVPSQLRRGVHRSVAELCTAIEAFVDAHNADPRPFRWTKSADDILASIERFCFLNGPQTA
jgi:hypothetical protein